LVERLGYTAISESLQTGATWKSAMLGIGSDSSRGVGLVNSVFYNVSFNGTKCLATQQSTATVIAGECRISGTTATVTAASSNSNTWAILAF
jgi:hypothetical protein